jgi:hypothetical protein
MMSKYKLDDLLKKSTDTKSNVLYRMATVTVVGAFHLYLLSYILVDMLYAFIPEVADSLSNVINLSVLNVTLILMVSRFAKHIITGTEIVDDGRFDTVGKIMSGYSLQAITALLLWGTSYMSYYILTATF